MGEHMHLIQFTDERGSRAVAVTEGGTTSVVNGATSVYALATEAIERGLDLRAAGDREGSRRHRGQGQAGGARAGCWPRSTIPTRRICMSPAPALPISARPRRATRCTSRTSRPPRRRSTDSMKMFRMGLEGGKPAPGEVGVQPEWFYKGNGSTVVAPGAADPVPGLRARRRRGAGDRRHLRDRHGRHARVRVGFALGNEFSDHVTERRELPLPRPFQAARLCSFGPELRVGDLPRRCRGHVRASCATAKVVWEKPFLSGEDNMSRTLANLEQHHFKYALFRQPRRRPRPLCSARRR